MATVVTMIVSISITMFNSFIFLKYMCIHNISLSTVLDHFCVRLASSFGRASERKSEGRGFESHVRLTLYLESKKISTT